MDILTALDSNTNYSSRKLQMIISAWVMSKPFQRKSKIATNNGDVSEDDYTKQSIYSLLYAIYRTVGDVSDGAGQNYEFTFNTWGYTWPEEWHDAPNSKTDPQIFGRNAYSGLFHFPEAQAYVAEREGKVSIVEMGCGTGAGAHHVCSNVLPQCTYEAVDMQMAGIATCRRKFVPELNGRLKATQADATKLDIADGSQDFVVVNETHVTEHPGVVSKEDELFLGTAKRILKPGGYLVWGNAIPEATWQPCFDYLESIGMKVIEVCDVTKEAVVARDRDFVRVEAYVKETLDRFHGFKIPFIGKGRRLEAEQALKNFFRHPGTNLYENMKDGTDTYKVSLVQKTV
jgi:ubiquinone/menaquinone biosynthesis C-methylase UbiE